MRRASLALALFVAAPIAAEAQTTYYVIGTHADSDDCTPATTGSGTLGDPYTNLFYAAQNAGLTAGDTLQLRGGSTEATAVVYEYRYAGFAADCNFDGVENTMIPLDFAGSSGNPIIIENYPGEHIILRSTDADLNDGTWTSCGTNSWQISWNTGSGSTGQLWANPTTTSPGTRLVYDGTGGCAGLAAGEFRIDPSPDEVYVRMPDDSDANDVTWVASVRSGEGGYSWATDEPTSAWITVRVNPSGGTFKTYGFYYGAFIDADGQNLTFSITASYGCGARDFGGCTRVYDGDYITYTGRSSADPWIMRESMSHCQFFYGGGPGSPSAAGIQITNNVAQYLDIDGCGRAFEDGGGIGNNLGVGSFNKNCSDCAHRDLIINDTLGAGCVSVTVSSDVGESADVTVERNIFTDCGHRCLNPMNNGDACTESRTFAALKAEPQRGGCTGGCVRNVTFQNNIINNNGFVPNQSETPVLLNIEDAGNTAMTGIVVINNTFANGTGGCIYVDNNSQLVLRNNTLSACGGTNFDLSSGDPAADTDNNNWQGAGTVVDDRGTTYTTGTVTTYESTALTVDPSFVNASTDLHIQAGSSLIDAGTSTGAPSDDVDAETRAGNPDVGADEFVNPLSVPVSGRRGRVVLPAVPE